MVIDKIQILEALLFASDEPLTIKRIREIIPEIGTEKTVKKQISEIDEKYEKHNSPFKIIELAGGFQIATREEFATWISKLYKSRTRAKLTRKGLETLAIIAYKQPITKIEVENIRGVNSDSVIRTLIERNLITVKGREKAPGNPLLYGTTNYFLEYFGINDVSHLPKLKEIDELIKGDSKFLESLDQVALDQMMPEILGLNPQADETGAEEETGQIDFTDETDNMEVEADENTTAPDENFADEDTAESGDKKE
jgi:segregation and condensation protein B